MIITFIFMTGRINVVVVYLPACTIEINEMYAHMPYIDPIGIQARAIFFVKFVFSANLAARTLPNKIFSLEETCFFLYHASFCRCGTLQLGVTKTRLFVAANAAQHTTTFPPRRLVGSAIGTTHAL